MTTWLDRLRQGQVIPASPLALFENGQWSEQHQRALFRYYLACEVGGLAVGVHSTQFAIRDPDVGLFAPLLELASQTIESNLNGTSCIRIAGACGETEQAASEAELARDFRFDACLVSLAGRQSATDAELVQHLKTISDIIPIIGFYLQPAVGGRNLSYRFWRDVLEIERLVAIKIAPFDRYATSDVIRATVDSQRDDVALYTGNDDNIVNDLVTPFPYGSNTRFIAGGLLGQWGVWTKRVVEMFNEIRAGRSDDSIPSRWLTWNAQITDINSALFDAAHQFNGCIPGIGEVLRRQGLVPSNRCLDPMEILSPGQLAEIDRVYRDYPQWNDDEFVRDHLSEWLS